MDAGVESTQNCGPSAAGPTRRSGHPWDPPKKMVSAHVELRPRCTVPSYTCQPKKANISDRSLKLQCLTFVQLALQVSDKAETEPDSTFVLINSTRIVIENSKSDCTWQPESIPP
ncbi:hypothetical protein PGT21_050313 [Puccinia graminis f. sp. tritici]|uniref:Uncharacterized protein n=1 Tax=Puccinia graminis f. sp. tritici TaxID=56615 RepID=A0A5B0M5T6_PUCGR|nr:hypothetical protein PGT21_050313 [Puccinia graminis f. sp. tritici]